MSHFSPFDKKRYLIFVALKNNLFSSNSLSIFIINERQSTYVCVIHHNEIIISFILLRKAEKNKAKKKKRLRRLQGKEIIFLNQPFSFLWVTHWVYCSLLSTIALAMMLQVETQLIKYVCINMSMDRWKQNLDLVVKIFKKWVYTKVMTHTDIKIITY